MKTVLKKEGKDIRPILEKALLWQIHHPDGARDELLQFLQSP